MKNLIDTDEKISPDEVASIENTHSEEL